MSEEESGAKCKCCGKIVPESDLFFIIGRWKKGKKRKIDSVCEKCFDYVESYNPRSLISKMTIEKG